MAKARTKNYDDLLLKKGTILTPSSGRNLGPIAYVGEALAGFAMTDIMRIVPHTEADGFYLLAYLLTPTAQALIKRGRSGTNIDHLSPDDVLGIDVPWIEDEGVRNGLVEEVKSAEAKLDEGRRGLDAAATKFHKLIGIEPIPSEGKYISRKCGDAFSKDLRTIGLRLDAAYHDPTVTQAATILRAKGGVPLGTIAKPKMLGRYKRFYVEEPHGRPILSGRQILQLRQVNLKRISDRSFKNPESFLLKTGSTIFTCDGRSEEALGEPGYPRFRMKTLGLFTVFRAESADDLSPPVEGRNQVQWDTSPKAVSSASADQSSRHIVHSSVCSRHRALRHI